VFYRDPYVVVLFVFVSTKRTRTTGKVVVKIKGVAGSV
jgi:hypothetical protein